MKQRELSIAFQTNKTAQEYIALAQQVNQYAFDAVSVYCDAPFHPSYAPLMLMAPYITQARLGAAAVSPSRMHPMDIAANTALLAGLAHGGVYVGIARGAWLDAHGIAELAPPLQAIREAVEVVQYFLEGRDDGYQGEVFQIAEHVRAPYPLPQERIPILIGSWGQKLCGIAGEIADEVKIGGTANPDVVPVIRSYINAGEQRTQRKPNNVNVVVGAVCVVDDDRDQARAFARREVALYLPIVAELDPTITLEPDLVARLRHHADQHEYDAAGRLISDDLLDRFVFAGDHHDVIRHCELLFEAGTNRIEFGTPHGLDSHKGIDILGKRVLPALT